MNSSAKAHGWKKRYARIWQGWVMASKPRKIIPAAGFASLVNAIRDVHAQCGAQAIKAVNISLTFRNWLIGAHIHHYELSGADRAAYGDRLLNTLAGQLTAAGISNCDRRQLYRYLRFYRLYPEIAGTLSPQFAVLQPPVGQQDKNVGAASPQSADDALQLLTRLSYSHLEELIELEAPLQRRFYEIEALRGNWSVRELKRQIATQYFQRSSLSTDKQALARLAQAQAEPQQSRQVIRDPYVFEFLGLKPQEVMSESHLEDALLDKLQEFLLELGHGFCFEARQKRLLIGGEHYFVDLVFYHRILKCHVLIELKNDAFKHEHLGQLNSYVGYYQQNEMNEGDQPPVGILLCTRKNHELVEYALAGMSNNLFVSRYQVQLPGKEQMAAFLHKAVEELGDGDE
jgi:predicted nuclease of restriction endonuclease-like (RecB) superfamily